MKNMDVYIAVVIVFVLLILIYTFSGKKPESKTFSCSRCKKREQYSQRTLEAWRRGFKKIYCRQCHKKWLESNPNHKRQKTNYNSGSGSGSGSGCLSVLLIALFIPVTIYTVSTLVS